jgi:T5SS/PEP-CTERM-associated repeat protein
VIGNNTGVSGTATVTGAGATWTNASNDVAAPLAIGGSGNGTLNILAGGQLSDFSASIARETGSTGAALVSGAGSLWTNRGTLTVGDGGTGTLNVSGGAQLNDDTLIVGGFVNGMLTISSAGKVDDRTSFIGSGPTSTGSVTVTGAGSKWTQTGNLTIGGVGVINGNSATGSLHVSLGGRIDTGGDAQIGSAGSATARLEDSASQWNVTGAMNVSDVATLFIVSGAKAIANTANVRGTVWVDEAGSSWAIANYLNIAGTSCLGTGCTVTPSTVNVGDGAHVDARVTQVGATFGSAQVFVDGAGSTWTTPEQLYVGLSGGGRFGVTGGAQVNTGTTELGVAPTASGIVSVDASNWTNSGEFTVGVAGTGKLTVSSGGTVSAGGSFVIGPQGTLEGNSHVAANVRNEGHVAPGIAISFSPPNAIGSLHIDGTYTQTSIAALDIQLASAASLDTLSITGAATLNGTLNVTLFNGFIPAAGNSVDLLTAGGGITGRFTTLNLPSILTTGHGPYWTVLYTSTDVILKLVNSPTGDYNHNGVVDAADYTVWRDTLGQTTFPLPADGDGNHVIDANDYAIWKSNFGQTAGSGASDSQSVPEPSTVAILLTGIAMLLPRHRRAARHGVR